MRTLVKPFNSFHVRWKLFVYFFRAVKIKLMCDESKYPGETNGITEDYHPLDSVYVGILVLYLIVSL